MLLEQNNELIRTACRCMSRLSVAFAAADDVKEKLTNLISNIYAAVKIDSIKNILIVMHTQYYILITEI